MKTKLLLLLFLFAFKLPTFAQQKVVKYCEVFVGGSGIKITATIYMGKVDSLFSPKDPNIIVQLQKVNTLKTKADVLNYMSYLGWSLVTVTQHEFFYFFYFKREFDPSELTTSKP